MLIAICILVLAIILAVYFSRNKSAKRKFTVWGITTIVFVAPLLSWILGILFGMNKGDGFVGMTVMVYGFVFLMVIGFILLYYGIFKRERPKF
ncbi:hypothetical protein ACH0B5_15145 [Ureibacillus sp. 179-F W5.1 NHS]|uniref:Uncharacterized protein n=2 Tax=Bacillales TaxID=1385 RepID=A0A3M8HFI4_9BACI|nr:MULTISPECIES: hypothetical protein [Bacillales]MBD8027454.1 hypothetical protein [Ureibacillus galli]RND01170.1 hypothetical protein EC501_02660 [Lysinibacillus halotolerans]